MNEPVEDPFIDSGVYSKIVGERDDIEDRLAHGKQLTASQLRHVRMVVKQLSPPSGAEVEPQAISMFGHRLSRFTDMLRAACFEQQASTGAADDLNFLVEIGESVLRNRVVGVESERAMATLRGIRVKAEFLLAHGGCVGTGKMAKMMGVQRETPRKRWEAGKLIGVRSGNKLQFPIWQLQDPDETGVVKAYRGIPEIVEIVRENHGSDWDIFAFFLSDNIHLADVSAGKFQSPVEALRAGHVKWLIHSAQASFLIP